MPDVQEDNEERLNERNGMVAVATNEGGKRKKRRRKTAGGRVEYAVCYYFPSIRLFRFVLQNHSSDNPWINFETS